MNWAEWFLVIVGTVVVSSVAIALLIGLWWFILNKLLNNWRETWWIAAYACWKRKHGVDAKRALAAAIRAESNWKD